MIDPALAIRMVRESAVIAYDTETSGLGPDAFVVGYVVTNSDHSVYVPVRHQPGGNIPDVEYFERCLADTFRVRSRLGNLTVGHHLSFDLRMSRRHGVILDAPLEDTMINEGLVNDLTKGFGLDDCAARHGVQPKKGAELYAYLASKFGGVPDRKQMSNFWRLSGDDPLGVAYAVGDGVSTLQVWEKQQPILDEMGLRRVHKLECDLIPRLDRIHARGLRLDLDYAERVGKSLESRIKEAYEQFPKGFNVRSPKDVEQAFRSLGIVDFAKTDKGAPSFREDWLEGHELGRAILAVRRLEKARDSFIAPLVETHNCNGRVHPILNQSKSDSYGAIGGRFSCSEPNLQAFPKRNEDVGKVVRPLVVPDEEMDFYEGDFRQQEPRLFAHYSEDENLLAGYRKTPEEDIHTTASKMTGRPRNEAKRIGLGILTGLGYQGLADRMGWDLARATDAHNQFLRDAFPGIKNFQEKAKQVMLRRGFVRTLLGRVAHSEGSRYAYKAVSRIIQGSGADHMKLALLRACEYTESLSPGTIDILMTIHDSNIWQAHKGADKEVVELQRVIENVAQELGLILPIPIDIGVGANWAEASYGK